MATAQYNRYSLLSGENSPQRGTPETVGNSNSSPVRNQVDRRPVPEKKPWRSFQGDPQKKPSRKATVVPEAVLKQLELRKKHNYTYRLISNGNIENNCTLYVNTGVAHTHQIEELFKDVIERAKKMTEVFGDNFECDVKVNVVRRQSGEYMAYAFVDLTNPKLYYALIGCNVDGSERAIYIDDPNWTPPTPTTAKIVWTSGKSWADEDDSEPVFKLPSAPKIRREQPPLLTLRSYSYDKQQMDHLQTQETQGTVTVSPAFITPGISEEYDDCSLYVSEVPEIDYDFLYEIFSRYARSSSPNEDAAHFFPRITIRKSNKEGEAHIDKGLYAIVQYAHPYDAKYALQMLQKIRARYNGADISMPVRHAFNNNRKKKQ